MTQKRSELGNLIPLAWAGYPVAVLLVVAPLMDFATSILPYRLGEETWRFGSFGLLGTALLTPLLGAWLLAVAGAVLNHRKIQWAVVGGAGVLAILLVPISILALLDFVQLRASVMPEAKFAFDVSAFKVFVIYGLGFVTLATLAYTGIRRLRRTRPTKEGEGWSW